MLKEELENIASELYDLELKCSKGESISERLQQIDEIIDTLELDEIFYIASLLEEKSCKF